MSKNKRCVTAISDVEGYLEPSKVQRILDNCYGDKKERDRLLFFILFRTGRRLSEVLPIKPRHIGLGSGNNCFQYIEKKNQQRPKKKESS